ncbi:MAG: hypothetical protein LVS60_10395 [Nodosilinea sp. LVE1205-7]
MRANLQHWDALPQVRGRCQWLLTTRLSFKEKNWWSNRDRPSALQATLQPWLS